MYVDDIKLAGKTENIKRLGKFLMKDVDLGEPTLFLDHVWKDNCELANKTTQQFFKVATPCMDDHHFKEEENKSVVELSTFAHKLL